MCKLNAMVLKWRRTKNPVIAVPHNFTRLVGDNKKNQANTEVLQHLKKLTDQSDVYMI